MGSSRVARWPHLGLRSVVTRPYAGITGAIEQPGGFVLPATASVLLVMKVEDSALRPPQFVHGAHATYATIDGACAPSYAQVSLAPLGAYSVLGMPMDELSGQLVDMHDVLGDAGTGSVTKFEVWRRGRSASMRSIGFSCAELQTAPGGWPWRLPTCGGGWCQAAGLSQSAASREKWDGVIST